MNTEVSDILICSPTAFPLLYSREVGGFGRSHRVHFEKGPADVVLPSPAEEVQPATGAAETVLLCHH